MRIPSRGSHFLVSRPMYDKTAAVVSDSSVAGKPIPGFHFRVDFGLENFLVKDVGFQSVTGIKFNLVEDVKEAGAVVGDSITSISKVEYSPLVLKRGMFRGSKLIDWMQAQATTKRRIAIPIVVTVLDGNSKPVYSWFFINAYPVSWETSGFNAEKGELLMEQITFKYLYFKQVNMIGKDVQKELQAMEKLQKAQAK
jgi:phage tail-like protein